MTEKGGRRRKQLLDNFKEKTGCLKLKEKEPNRLISGTRCERVYIHVVIQAMK
jgi:hypothetical protein